MRLTNELNLPQPFVSAVTSNYEYTDKRYSATSILKGVREMILQRRHSDEIEGDVADMVWLIFGSAVHQILENSEETAEQIKENKIAIEMPNDYTLSGIFDLYDDATGTVTDYKTASVWKVIYNEWEDYRKQTLIYCYMLRQIGFDAHRGEVVALLKDHSKSKAKFDPDYPNYPVYTISWDFTEKELDEIGAWLEQRFREIELAEKISDDELPICSEDERWHKPDKWAVKKKGNKKAYKLFDNEKDAIDMANEKGLEVEFRKGADGKCEGYCSAREYCSYWRNNNER